MREAAARARRGDGPTLIEFETFRMRGHEEASGTDYVPPALFEQWAARDPLLRFEAVASARGIWKPGELEAQRAAMVAEIDRLADLVLAEPDPTSTVDQELADVYGPPRPLARRELWILLEEWFKRIPEFRVKPGADTTVFPGLLSIRNLPLVWDVE